MENKKGRSAAQRNRLRMASVFLVFALLMNLFYIPCYYYIRNITRANALEYYRQKLYDGMDSLDTTLAGLSNLQAMLNQNPLIRSMSYMKADIDQTALDTVRDTVRLYLLPYDAAAESGLSLGDDILFTRRRIYYQREQLKAVNYFKSQGLSTADWLKRLTGTVCVLPAETFQTMDYGTYQGFTVAWRWSRANGMYLFTTFPLDKIFALMADKGVLAAGRVAITRGDALIAQSGQALESDYELLTVKANSVELDVSVQIPNAYIEQDLKQLQHLVQAFLAAVALATVVWVIVGAVTAARPLNRITDALYNTKHLAVDTDGRGSVADLAQCIKSLDSRLTNYEDTIAAQEKNLRTHTLEKALYRGLYNEESRDKFHHAFPLFPRRWQMAYIQYAPEETEVNKGLLTLLFTEYLHRTLSNAILLPTDNDTLLVILPSDDSEDPGQMLEALRLDMQARYSLLFSYTLSSPYDDPSALARAWQQLEYDASLPLTSDTAPHREKPLLSLQQLETMYMALSCGDEKAALNLLEGCTAPLLRGQDFFLFQHTYRMIANMLVMIKMEATCDLSDIPIPAFASDKIQQLYTHELPGCFSKIAARIFSQRKNLAQSLDRSIVSFIDANLGNPSLCITMVTDQFQISAPTLQKRLHEATGQTFSAYVEDARMNKARQALRETDRTVQEIAESCGYATPNSFYKAYKRRFGEAPLNVRK